MGHNFFFALSVVVGMKVPWRVALGTVAGAGLLFIATAGIGLRERVGVGQQVGLMRGGSLPRARQALLADAIGTVAGAVLGTSTVTAYIESGAGVAAPERPRSGSSRAAPSTASPAQSPGRSRSARRRSPCPPRSTPPAARR